VVYVARVYRGVCRANKNVAIECLTLFIATSPLSVAGNVHCRGRNDNTIPVARLAYLNWTKLHINLVTRRLSN